MVLTSQSFFFWLSTGGGKRGEGGWGRGGGLGFHFSSFSFAGHFWGNMWLDVMMYTSTTPAPSIDKCGVISSGWADSSHNFKKDVKEELCSGVGVCVSVSGRKEGRRGKRCPAPPPPPLPLPLFF
eukprot:Sspe_Gene.64378::Locus_37977_Transcript_1_1_Confidence_1.000_Length_730::g.64378::m.64378